MAYELQARPIQKGEGSLNTSYRPKARKATLKAASTAKLTIIGTYQGRTAMTGPAPPKESQGHVQHR